MVKPVLMDTSIVLRIFDADESHRDELSSVHDDCDEPSYFDSG